MNYYRKGGEGGNTVKRARERGSHSHTSRGENPRTVVLSQPPSELLNYCDHEDRKKEPSTKVTVGSSKIPSFTGDVGDYPSPTSVM